MQRGAPDLPRDWPVLMASFPIRPGRTTPVGLDWLEQYDPDLVPNAHVHPWPGVLVGTCASVRRNRVTPLHQPSNRLLVAVATCNSTPMRCGGLPLPGSTKGGGGQRSRHVNTTDNEGTDRTGKHVATCVSVCVTAEAGWEGFSELTPGNASFLLCCSCQSAHPAPPARPALALFLSFS